MQPDITKLLFSAIPNFWFFVWPYIYLCGPTVFTWYSRVALVEIMWGAFFTEKVEAYRWCPGCFSNEAYSKGIFFFFGSAKQHLRVEQWADIVEVENVAERQGHIFKTDHFQLSYVTLRFAPNSFNDFIMTWSKWFFWYQLDHVITRQRPLSVDFPPKTSFSMTWKKFFSSYRGSHCPWDWGATWAPPDPWAPPRPPPRSDPWPKACNVERRVQKEAQAVFLLFCCVQKKINALPLFPSCSYSIRRSVSLSQMTTTTARGRRRKVSPEKGPGASSSSSSQLLDCACAPKGELEWKSRLFFWMHAKFLSQK